LKTTNFLKFNLECSVVLVSLIICLLSFSFFVSFLSHFFILSSRLLDSNSLTKLGTGVFESLSNLNSLSVYGNSLIYIEDNIFGASTKLPDDISFDSNNLISLPSNFSSAANSYPSFIDVEKNCLDCSLYPYSSSLYYCDEQGDSHCPTSTILCNSLDKFQKDHCFKCGTNETDSFCDICMPGYKHTESGCGCVKCEEGDTCTFGEVRDSESPCAHCTSELPAQCTSCAANYKLVNGDCVKCSSDECCPGGENTVLEHCSGCTSDQSKCSACQSGYKLVSGTCVECESGECCGFNNTGGDTIKQNCYGCTKDQSQCTACPSGYKLVSGECIECSANECCAANNTGDIGEYCFGCEEGTSKCRACIAGHKLVAGKCESCKYDECCAENNTGDIIEHCYGCTSNYTECVA